MRDNNTPTQDDVMKISLLKAIWHRLPWLVIGLLGGILTAEMVRSFEEVLQRNLILAAFIPLLVYMADAVGTQMESFIIRDTALHPHLKFWRYLFRQLYVVGVLGGIIAIILFGISLVLYNDAVVSLVLAFSIFLAILSSVITGLFIPVWFEKLQLDPANASGPIATIIQDFISIMVYFAVASILL